MSNWIVKWRPARPDAEIRLFCFPYAGGGAAAYRPWANHLPESVEVCAIQLPGHGSRIRERPLTDLTEIIDTIRRELDPLLDRPFAFFGHSMGAVVAAEVCRKLEHRGGAAPRQLFLSGRRPPGMADPQPPLRHLSDADFVSAINSRYGAIPTEIMAEPDVLALLLPALRADIVALETHHFVDREPMRAPIMVMGGEDDSQTPRAHLAAWRDETSGSCELRLFPGGHFYLDACRREVLDEVSRLLLGDHASEATAVVDGAVREKRAGD